MHRANAFGGREKCNRCGHCDVEVDDAFCKERNTFGGREVQRFVRVSCADCALPRSNTFGWRKGALAG